MLRRLFTIEIPIFIEIAIPSAYSLALFLDINLAGLISTRELEFRRTLISKNSISDGAWLFAALRIPDRPCRKINLFYFRLIFYIAEPEHDEFCFSAPTAILQCRITRFELLSSGLQILCKLVFVNNCWQQVLVFLWWRKIFVSANRNWGIHLYLGRKLA